MTRRRAVEGVDYTVEAGGRLVFAREYHLKRGYCCRGRCRNCPWKEAKEVVEMSEPNGADISRD